MKRIGVIEGFFGSPWPHDDRVSYAEFLSRHGGDFYIYAPKQDAHLRRKWREPWDTQYIGHLKSLVNSFHKEKVKFGIGFSPLGLGTELLLEDKQQLKEKLQILQNLGIDMLGLFFDDMPTNDNLAKTQLQALKLVQESYKGEVIFCPSYYTPDPILDKIFGRRPEGYLEEIAEGVPLDVAIIWTGPKVISPEISAEHLIETGKILKRKPFIWENLFANDGPSNCKFLKLKPFSGRTRETFDEAEAFGFNMMNQAQLSKILYLSSKFVLEGESDPEKALVKALDELCSPDFKAFILKYKDSFLATSVDKISDADKKSLISELEQFNDSGSVEIIDWLNGKYTVGSECLTD